MSEGYRALREKENNKYKYNGIRTTLQTTEFSEISEGIRTPYSCQRILRIIRMVAQHVAETKTVLRTGN